MEDLLWWGYLHVEGSIQAKRYFGPQDIHEAHESPFVASTYGPFSAEDRDHALQILSKHLV